jgi:hypothetical protein
MLVLILFWQVVFYQAPHVKNIWIFQNIKDNVNALTSKFDKHMGNIMNRVKLCDNLICTYTNFK